MIFANPALGKVDVHQGIMALLNSVGKRLVSRSYPLISEGYVSSDGIPESKHRRCFKERTMW